MQGRDTSYYGALLVVGIVLIMAILGVQKIYRGYFVSDEYIAFFYYDPTDPSKYWSADVESIDDCRNWVESQSYRDFDGYYDYECGVNCRYDFVTNNHICKELVE